MLFNTYLENEDGHRLYFACYEGDYETQYEVVAYRPDLPEGENVICKTFEAVLSYDKYGYRSCDLIPHNVTTRCGTDTVLYYDTMVNEREEVTILLAQEFIAKVLKSTEFWDGFDPFEDKSGHVCDYEFETCSEVL